MVGPDKAVSILRMFNVPFLKAEPLRPPHVQRLREVNSPVARRTPPFGGCEAQAALRNGSAKRMLGTLIETATGSLSTEPLSPGVWAYQ